MTAAGTFIPYEAVSSLTIDANGNAIVPGGFGYDPASFAVVVPGAEWSVNLAPIDGADDVGAVLASILPMIWTVADPTQAAFVKIVPGLAANNLILRVCGVDLVTPAPGVAFVVGFTLLRRVGI